MNDTQTPKTKASKTRVIKNGFSPIIYYCYANDMAKLELELTTVTKQRDRLAESLERILDYKGRFAEEDPESIAREALKSLITNK